jgi:predicted nucleic acid-binding protein
MKSKVYLETSIVSYLTAFPSSDLIAAGHQLTTFDWWENHRQNFEVVASELVIQEAGLGNMQMAQKRLAILKAVKILDINDKARNLAKMLVAKKAVPEKAAADALHIAIAAAEKIEFLATWNFKHIANAKMQAKIKEVIRAEDYEPSHICTLEELLGE